MKCDELKAKRHIDEDTGITFSFYGKSEVDAAIAELKAQKAQAEDDCACDPVPCVEVYLKSEADKVIAELEKENESLKYSVASLETDLAMSRRWRKCSEELPEVSVEVLVTNGIDCEISDWCEDYWNNDPFCGYTVYDNVIAWMPLPATPRRTNEKNRKRMGRSFLHGR